MAKKRLKANKRRVARFQVRDRSTVFPVTVTWNIEVSEGGLKARRDMDGCTAYVSWKQVLGAALYYGRTEKGNEQI
ncbi:MAG: hypothetical protein KAJ42_15460 [Gemmatimonadetes bacterium]|nr:hypothetical protein [Gemmatimonadota bacterium]